MHTVRLYTVALGALISNLKIIINFISVFAVVEIVIDLTNRSRYIVDCKYIVDQEV